MAAYEQAEQVALALGDSVRLGTVYGNRGNVYVQLNKYVDATRHFNRAIELYTVAGDSARAQRARMALGNIFLIIGHNELAMDEFEAVETGMTVDAERTHFPGLLNLNMGWCAYQMKDYAGAGLPLCIRTRHPYQGRKWVPCHWMSCQHRRTEKSTGTAG